LLVEGELVFGCCQKIERPAAGKLSFQFHLAPLMGHNRSTREASLLVRQQAQGCTPLGRLISLGQKQPPIL